MEAFVTPCHTWILDPGTIPTFIIGSSEPLLSSLWPSNSGCNDTFYYPRRPQSWSSWPSSFPFWHIFLSSLYTSNFHRFTVGWNFHSYMGTYWMDTDRHRRQPKLPNSGQRCGAHTCDDSSLWPLFQRFRLGLHSTSWRRLSIPPWSRPTLSPSTLSSTTLHSVAEKLFPQCP